MKLFIPFLFGLLYVGAVSNQVKQTDYCLHPNPVAQCRNCPINQYICMREHSFACSDGLCSKDKQSCRDFKFWAMVVNKYVGDARISFAFNEFGMKIKDCPEWKPTDVCFNRKICHQKQKIPFGLQMSKKFITKSKCKCPSAYSYVCGDDYCALDRGACQQLNVNVIGIKNCKRI